MSDALYNKAAAVNVLMGNIEFPSFGISPVSTPSMSPASSIEQVTMDNVLQVACFGRHVVQFF